MDTPFPLLKPEAAEILSRLRLGMKLTRPVAMTLLRNLERLSSDAPGCEIMQAQLRAILQRKDWLVISVTADPKTVRTTGVSIGIIEQKLPKPSTRLSPMQKWQRKHSLLRR